MTGSEHPTRRVPAARSGAVAAAVSIALAVACAAASPSPASAAPPDRAYATPVAAGSASAQTSLSAGKLRRGLTRALKSAGGRSGAWVADLTGGRTLFKRSAKTRRAIASNMKLFVTAAALVRLGPEFTTDTRLWAVGPVAPNGTLNGYLVLRGNGDPGLGGSGLGALVRDLKQAGITRVKGRVHYDDFAFDRRRTVPQHGITGGPYLGYLSGLSYAFGRHRNPGFKAAAKLRGIMRKRGVRVGTKILRRKVSPGAPNAQLIGVHESASLLSLAAQTNVYSDNFYAEMLTKLLGHRLRKRGTTRDGLRVVRGFAAKRGAKVVAENGSGLSTRDRASPLAVGRLLRSMRDQVDQRSDAFRQSLAIAGVTGTLANRMRGTAAAGRCRAKTGTLTAVSALSGYCFVGGRILAFSILNNKVNTDRARRAQDRMAALIARYRA